MLNDATKNNVNNIYFISHDDLSSFSLDPKIKIITPKNDIEIAKYYNKSKIFISPSWWEGFGLPPLEAMASGCLVLSSKSGGVDEFLEENQNCLMFTPQDDIQQADLLEKAINNYAQYKSLIQTGIESSKNFSWKNSTIQLKNILDEYKC